MMWKVEVLTIHPMLLQLFHNAVFGGKGDYPTINNAYGWTDIITHKDKQNADSYAMLGLAVEILGKGYNIAVDGSVARP